MNSRPALFAALMSFMGACDLNVVVEVYTPPTRIIEIRSVEQDQGSQNGAMGQHTPVRRSYRLPICYLSRCTGPECVSKVSALIASNRARVWSYIERKPEEAQIFTNGGYYVQVSSVSPFSSISQSWSDGACLSDPDDTEGAIKARTRQCRRHMRNWVEIAVGNSVEALELDQKFRSTCLRSE